MKHPSCKKVFIDGGSGILGQEIGKRLDKYSHLDLIKLKDDKRRQADARLEAAGCADLTVVCLPDEDTSKICTLYERETSTRILDAGSRHRVAAGWTYGLPELGARQSGAIQESRKVSNPGCYALAIVLIMRPLIEAGIISRECPLNLYALSGYSGGGKALVRDYESMLDNHPIPVPYSLTRKHKHIDEIMRYSHLVTEPVFIPAVGDFYRGIRVFIPINRSLSSGSLSLEEVASVYADSYSAQDRIRIYAHATNADINRVYMDTRELESADRLDIHLIAHESGHLIISGILDNLGMGSASTAEKNVMLMLG